MGQETEATVLAQEKVRTDVLTWKEDRTGGAPHWELGGTIMPDTPARCGRHREVGSCVPMGHE